MKGATVSMPQDTENTHHAPKDSQGRTWMMRLVPSRFEAFAQLARLDRPIGTWLLFWPCFWGLALAAGQIDRYPPLFMVGLFALGALVMRSAGCTFNDLADRNIDEKVARTALRPLPSGRVSVRQAWGFLIGLCLIGFFILVQFNGLTIALGFASLSLVAIYPFMKRITYWPQFFLGLTFNWGALMGYAALAGKIDAAALALYAAGVFWTLGYDTIYAHQDREEDALIGVKSTALKLGRFSRPAIAVFYALALACLALAGLWADVQVLFWPGLAVAAYHLGLQILKLDIDRADICLSLFRANRDTGLIIAGALLLGTF